MNDGGNPIVQRVLPRAGRAGDAGARLVAPGEPAWYVESGEVAVFLCAATGGARTFLLAVGAGQLMVFPEPERDDGFVLLAAPAPGTRYRVIGHDELLALANDPACPAALAPKFDAVADRLGRQLALSPSGEGVPPQWQPDGTMRMAEAPVLGQPGCWVELLSGQAGWCGVLDMQPGKPLAAPAGTWIGAEPGTTLRLWASGALCEHGHAGAVLDGVAMLLRRLAEATWRQQQEAAADELLRLQSSEANNSAAMSRSLHRLAALFARREEQIEPGSDRLLHACRLVGAHMGIRFQAAGAGRGGTAGALRRIAEASGVRMRKVALTGQWWRQDNGPLLVLHGDAGLPFALLPAAAGYHAVDPCNGERSDVDAHWAEGLAPFGYMFYAALPAQPLALGDVLRFVLARVRGELPAVVMLAMASTLLAMAVPLASGQLFDSVFPAADRNQLVQIVAILCISSVAALLFETARALVMLRIEGKASNDVQAAVWDRVLNLPMTFFRDYTAGDLASRINGINEIRQMLSGTLLTTMISSLFSSLNIFLLFYYSVPLALLALALVAVAVGFNLVLGYFGARLALQTNEAAGKVTGHVLELLSGIAKLRMTGAEPRAFARWAAGFAEQKRLALRAGTLANVSSVFGAVFPVLANAAILVCTALPLSHGAAAQFTTGDFIAFSAAWTIFAGAVLSLAQCGIELLKISALYQRTKPVLLTAPETSPDQADPGPLLGNIELSKVSFSYAPGAPLVLDDISLSIKAGEFIALVGASGSGKSTLLRLLLGFERPLHGGIYYDNNNLGEVDVRMVRQQLGVVLQSGRLMSGDIFSNIIGASGLTLDDAWAAARACGFDQDIEAMPMGMHTLVNDGGGGLSGGQRQRLLIARALVNQPRIMFLDEATSALDNHSQAVVSASMERMQATRVVIAHRLSTIINADRIYVLDKGRIVQTGSYEQLMRQEGLFAELAKRQMA